MGTLVKVCRKHAEGDVNDVVPYFWRAVLNNGQHARRDWDLVVDEERFATEDDNPEAALALQQELAAVRAALAKLNSSERLILELRYVDGLRNREIAERLGKSEPAVRQQMKRARERLRRAFEREWSDR
jgi:RNA polymerase sigma factor (sigma-70 family)